MVIFILLSTTGLRAAVHQCIHHFSDNNSSISLSISPVEELCSHHTKETSCCTHAHEGHKADGHCATHHDCCSTDLYFAQLEFDGLEDNPNQNLINDDALAAPVIFLPVELTIFPVDFFIENRQNEKQIPILQKTQQSFLSQYRN